MNINNKIDVLSKLSPGMKRVIEIQSEIAGSAFDTTGVTYDQLRLNYEKERKYWNEGGPRSHKIEEIKIPTKYGEVEVRLYYPEKVEIMPCIVYIHGGGMVVGNNNTHDRIMRILSESSKSVVAGVNYSLSPEAKFPQALLECTESIKYLLANADSLGLDRNKFGIAGDSGGANLSMGCYLYLRDHLSDTSNIKALLLYYGMYGLRDSGSMKLLGGDWDGLTESDLNYYTEMYISNEKDLSNPYYNHYEADLTFRMPACFIVASDLDPLLDDSKTLYQMLIDKKVPCEYKEYKGLLHAFLHYSKVIDEAKEAITLGGDFFIKHCN